MRLTDEGWEGKSKERLVRLQHSYLCYLLGIIDLIAVTSVDEDEELEAEVEEESSLPEPPPPPVKRFLGE